MENNVKNRVLRKLFIIFYSFFIFKKIFLFFFEVCLRIILIKSNYFLKVHLISNYEVFKTEHNDRLGFGNGRIIKILIKNKVKAMMRKKTESDPPKEQ